MKKTLTATLVVVALAGMSASVAANPSGGKATGDFASSAGGSISDHVTGGAANPGTGTATVKSGGKNMSGGRPD